MTQSLKSIGYNTELNCHIANICSGYAQVPDLTVKYLIDSAGFWLEEEYNSTTQSDRNSYFARAEAFKAAARELVYQLTDCKEDSEDSDSE